jgi:hypothetical protein
MLSSASVIGCLGLGGKSRSCPAQSQHRLVDLRLAPFSYPSCNRYFPMRSREDL